MFKNNWYVIVHLYAGGMHLYAGSTWSHSFKMCMPECHLWPCNQVYIPVKDVQVLLPSPTQELAIEKHPQLLCMKWDVRHRKTSTACSHIRVEAKNSSSPKQRAECWLPRGKDGHQGRVRMEGGWLAGMGYSWVERAILNIQWHSRHYSW